MSVSAVLHKSLMAARPKLQSVFDGATDVVKAPSYTNVEQVSVPAPDMLPTKKTVVATKTTTTTTTTPTKKTPPRFPLFQQKKRMRMPDSPRPTAATGLFKKPSVIGAATATSSAVVAAVPKRSIAKLESPKGDRVSVLPKITAASDAAAAAAAADVVPPPTDDATTTVLKVATAEAAPKEKRKRKKPETTDEVELGSEDEAERSIEDEKSIRREFSDFIVDEDEDEMNFFNAMFGGGGGKGGKGGDGKGIGDGYNDFLNSGDVLNSFLRNDLEDDVSPPVPVFGRSAKRASREAVMEKQVAEGNVVGVQMQRQSQKQRKITPLEMWLDIEAVDTLLYGKRITADGQVVDCDRTKPGFFSAAMDKQIGNDNKHDKTNDERAAHAARHLRNELAEATRLAGEANPHFRRLVENFEGAATWTVSDGNEEDPSKAFVHIVYLDRKTLDGLPRTLLIEVDRSVVDKKTLLTAWRATNWSLWVSSSFWWQEELWAGDRTLQEVREMLVDVENPTFKAIVESHENCLRTLAEISDA